MTGVLGASNWELDNNSAGTAPSARMGPNEGLDLVGLPGIPCARAERHLAIRRALWEQGQARGHTMWIAEYSQPNLTDQTPWRQIVDTCVAGVVDCDLLVALFFRRWRAESSVDDVGPSATSFFEIELFHAALRRIPVVFVEVDDFRPDPELARLVAVLKSVTRPEQWLRTPEPELEATVLTSYRRRRQPGPPATLARHASYALSSARSFRRVPEELRSVRLSLLGLFRSDRRGRTLFRRPRRRTPRGGPSSRGGRPAELCGSPVASLDGFARTVQLPAEAIDAEAIAAWTELADLWAKSGRLAATARPLAPGCARRLADKGRHQRQIPPRNRAAVWRVRQRGLFHRQDLPHVWLADPTIFGGAGARDPPSRAERRPVRRVADPRQRDPPARPPRRPWLVAPGRADYAAAVKFRERAGASASAIGEAQVELAFADYALGRVLFWVRADALARMREGVCLLEADHPERRPGFVKRAKEKLAIALEQHGLHDEAVVQRAQLAALKPAHGMPARGTRVLTNRRAGPAGRADVLDFREGSQAVEGSSPES